MRKALRTPICCVEIVESSCTALPQCNNHSPISDLMLAMGEDKKKKSWIDTQVEPAACGYVTAVDSSQKPALISMGKIIKILFNLIW